MQRTKTRQPVDRFRIKAPINDRELEQRLDEMLAMIEATDGGVCRGSTGTFMRFASGATYRARVESSPTGLDLIWERM